MSRPVYAFTIGEEHVGARTVKVDGRTYMTQNWIGAILPGDVGKKVFKVGDILQVENDEQRDKRLGGARAAREVAARAFAVQLEVDPAALVAAADAVWSNMNPQSRSYTTALSIAGVALRAAKETVHE